MMTDDRPKVERLVGVISDTHGLVRPEAVDALRGVEMILHAGDVGNAEVLEVLGGIAPVVAVRGNNDKGEWAEGLPPWEVVEIGAVSVYMLHDLKEIDISPSGGGFRAVVSGHSHRPSVEERRGVLYVNPGSAGPRRFSLPISVALLRVTGESVNAQVIELAVPEKVSRKVAPKLARLRAAKGSARELREEVADLNETVGELAEEVAQVKRAVRAARKRRSTLPGGAED